MSQHDIDTIKHVGDGVSIMVGLGALASILPPIAALLTIVWTAIRIWETRTVQRLMRRKDRPEG